jgi:hypothetical protein
MMILPRVTAFAGFFAERPFPGLFVTRHALVVKRVHAKRQRRRIRFEVAGIACGLLSAALAGKQLVALFAAFQFLVVHLSVAALALGVNGVAQGQGVPVGLVRMALVARSRLGLDVRAVMAVGAGRGILVDMVLMAPGQLAQFSMVAPGAGFRGQILLVVRGKFRVELGGMARAARKRAQAWRLTFVVAFCAVSAVFFDVFHVTGMGEDYIAALIVQSKTYRKLFRRCWRKLAADGQNRQHATDDDDGNVTIFQGSVLVLRLTQLQTRRFHQAPISNRIDKADQLFPT